VSDDALQQAEEKLASYHNLPQLKEHRKLCNGAENLIAAIDVSTNQRKQKGKRKAISEGPC